MNKVICIFDLVRGRNYPGDWCRLLVPTSGLEGGVASHFSGGSCTKVGHFDSLILSGALCVTATKRILGHIRGRRDQNRGNRVSRILGQGRRSNTTSIQQGRQELNYQRQLDKRSQRDERGSTGLCQWKDDTYGTKARSGYQTMKDSERVLYPNATTSP